MKEIIFGNPGESMAMAMAIKLITKYYMRNG
jgi:hypothetical protein